MSELCRRLLLHPLVQLTLSRAREFVREPEVLFWSYVFPVLLALALGIAFRSRPAAPSLVLIEEHPGASRALALLSASAELKAERASAEEAFIALRRGRADLIIRPQEDGSFLFLLDPARPESRLARVAALHALTAEDHPGPPVREEFITTPGSRYIDFLIPGLIGLNLMGSGMWGVGFNIVQARSRKLLRRLSATPMRRFHFLLSYILSRLIFLVPEVGLLVFFGWLVFDVHVAGSLVGLSLVSLMGALTFSGLGLLVASRPTTIEAVSGWMNLVMMPMWILSGSFFSYERFPQMFHPLIRLLPLTALNDALRSVMNEGAGLAASAPELLVLLAWGTVSFALALRLFRWQ